MQIFRLKTSTIPRMSNYSLKQGMIPSLKVNVPGSFLFLFTVVGGIHNGAEAIFHCTAQLPAASGYIHDKRISLKLYTMIFLTDLSQQTYCSVSSDYKHLYCARNQLEV